MSREQLAMVEEAGHYTLISFWPWLFERLLLDNAPPKEQISAHPVFAQLVLEK